jgi:SOS response regulatory protein OraA/RecX
MEGWIRIHRKILEWDWYSDINTKSVFLHLLLKSNFIEKSWKGISIKRGQMFTSISHLSIDIGISEKQIRNSLKKLQTTKEIEIKGASNGTMITVCNYEIYQSDENEKGEQTDKRRANEGQTKGERRANEGQLHKKVIKQECENVINQEEKEKESALFIPVVSCLNPTMEEVKKFFADKGYTEKAAKELFFHYNKSDWKYKSGKQVDDWKEKAEIHWFTKEENKIYTKPKRDPKGDLTMERRNKLYD